MHPENFWKLSGHAINLLSNEDSKWLTRGHCNLKYLELCELIKQNQVVENEKPPDDYSGGFNDYALECIILPSDENVEKDGNSSGNSDLLLDESSLATKIASAIKQDINDFDDIVSRANVGVLKSSLMKAWMETELPLDKQKFIKLLSAYPSCCSVICSNILLEKLNEEDSLYPTIEILCPVVEWLQMHVVNDLLIPLLASEGSIIFKKPICLKEIISSLSLSQKCELLRCFIGLMEKGLKRNHLEVLAILLDEVQLNDNLTTRLVLLLSHNINEFTEDRYLGKILLVILDGYSAKALHGVIKELTQVCNNFKGVMSLRINAALRKCIS